MAALCGRRIGAVEVSASAECSGALLGAPIISVLRCLACELEGSVQWPGQVGGRPAASLSYTAVMGGGGAPRSRGGRPSPRSPVVGRPLEPPAPPSDLHCLCVLHTECESVRCVSAFVCFIPSKALSKKIVVVAPSA